MTKQEMLQVVTMLQTTLQNIDETLDIIGRIHYSAFYSTEPYASEFMEIIVFFKHLDKSINELGEMINASWHDDEPEDNIPIQISDKDNVPIWNLDDNETQSSNDTSIKKISDEEIQQLKNLLGNIDLDI